MLFDRRYAPLRHCRKIPPYGDVLGRQMTDAQRYELAQVIAGADERDLAVAIRKGDYSKCRKALVKAIGTKACLYILESGMWGH